jgi:hypothetical protein
VQEYTASSGYRVTFVGQGALNDNNSVNATQALPLPVFGPSAITPQLIANSSLIAVLPNNQNSMVQQWNVQVQQQLDRFTSVTVAYVGNTSQHLTTWFNANAPVLGTGAPTYANRQTITEGSAEGAGNYAGLQVSANRSVGNNLLVTAAYTWSHTLDNSNGAFKTSGNGSAGAGARFFITPGGPGFRLNYGNSDQDQPNVFAASAVYNLPFGHGQHYGNGASGVTNQVIGGWQLNSIVILNGGTPFDINTSGIGNIDNRADVLSYKRVSATQVGGSSNANNRTFFSGTFGVPTQGTSASGSAFYVRSGNVERNQFFGPGYHVVNFGVFKDFPITERVRFQLRAQAYNLFNTPQFVNPDGDINNGLAQSNGTYTTGTSKSFGSINAVRQQSERQLEFAARVNF